MEARYFKIGVFIIASVSIAVVFLIVLGTRGKGPAIMFETYLDESVQGLEKGSPVRLQGVPLGKVESIGFVRTKYGVDAAGLVRVVFSCQQQHVGDDNVALIHERLQEWTSEGFRVRLASAGLMGGMYLEMSQVDPVEYPPREISWTPNYDRIPSMPSTSNELMSKIKGLVDKLDAVDIPGIATELQGTIANLNRATEGLPATIENIETGLIAELETLVATVNTYVEKDLQPTTAELSGIVREVRPQLDRFMKDLNRMLKEDVQPVLDGLGKSGEVLPETVKSLDRTIDRLDLLVRSEGFDLSNALRSLRGVLADLKSLTDGVKRNPASVILGDPPSRSRRDRGK